MKGSHGVEGRVFLIPTGFLLAVMYLVCLKQSSRLITRGKHFSYITRFWEITCGKMPNTFC